jgi:YD repeat-containing protein
MLLPRRRCSSRAVLSALTFGVNVAMIAFNTPPVIAQTPTYARHAYSFKLRCGCLRDCVATQSSTSPLTGNQSFTIPVTSWSFHGATYRFSLTYNSQSLHDVETPNAVQAPDFAGLCENNPKWSHSFAQWIDLIRDEQGKEHAVWRQNGRWITFQRTLPSGAWEAPDSYLKISSVAGSGNSPSFQCGGGSQTLPVPYASFTITDGNGTQYLFDTIYWSIGECQALPHYLLRLITDRWGRQLTITWTNQGSNPAEPRVTSVRDGLNQGLTLTYSGKMLTSVTDQQGRVHSLGFASVPDEQQINRQKLASVTVLGPASPGFPRPVWTWRFVYRVPPPENVNYHYGAWDGQGGNVYTGDLVVRKISPDASVVDYLYHRVSIPRTAESDWDGVIRRIRWYDFGESPAIFKEIQRDLIVPNLVRLTYPGGPQADFSYSSATGDLTSITDLAPNPADNRTWSYRWSSDGKHDLEAMSTPLEPAGTDLVTWTYEKSLGYISKITASYLQDAGFPRANVETLFDSRNLPTQITAFSRSGAKDQKTQFFYDEAGFALPGAMEGNLTRIKRGVGQGGLEFTAASLYYDTDDHTWGLPGNVTSAVAALSTFDFDNTTGLLINAKSPQNLSELQGKPDYDRSETVLEYNSDKLPSKVRDAEGHEVELYYSGCGPNNSLLQITQKFLADGSTRSVVLHAFGRVLESRDERGILTEIRYNGQSAVKTIVRAAGTPDQTVTSFQYDQRGDLVKITAPGGSQYQFEYVGYTQAGVSTGIYEGQVTRIVYPNSAVELRGYNQAGDLAWRKKADGKLIVIAERDALHRVKRIDYPADVGGGVFSVTAVYDEFGNVTSYSDQTGTTQVEYDVHNRVTRVTPSTGQVVEYVYTRDLTNKRWITTVTLNGVGSYVYEEDPKGRLRKVTSPFGHFSLLEYDKTGKNTLITYPNNVQEIRTYTTRDWLSGIQIKRSNGTVLNTLNYFYTDSQGVYDPTGHLRREVDANTREFYYNDRYELVGELLPGADVVGYFYDKEGNRTRRDTYISGTFAFTDYYGYELGLSPRLKWVNRNVNAQPASGQVAPYTLFGYDAAGRTITRDQRDDAGTQTILDFRWDAADDLRSIFDGGATCSRRCTMPGACGSRSRTT